MSLYHPHRAEILHMRELVFNHSYLLRNTSNTETVELLSDTIDSLEKELEKYKIGDCPKMSPIDKIMHKLV